VHHQAIQPAIDQISSMGIFTLQVLAREYLFSNRLTQVTASHGMLAI
jgi:hypothetical protein